MREPSFLLVDDDLPLLRSIRRWLRPLGAVIEAPTCSAARDVLRATYPLAVVVDLHLPDGSGFDLIATAKTHDPAVAAAILTGNDSADAKNRACELGAFFLPKPLNVHSLLAFCRRAVRERGSLDARLSVASHEWRQRFGLSEAEFDILVMASRGLTHHAIAEKRGCAIATINKHSEHILNKTGDVSLSAAALRLLRALANVSSA